MLSLKKFTFLSERKLFMITFMAIFLSLFVAANVLAQQHECEGTLEGTMCWKDYNDQDPGGYMPDIDQNQDFDLVQARTEETGAGVSFLGTWTVYNHEQNASGGTLKYSNDLTPPAAECSFTFHGTSIRWIGFMQNNMGISEVWIDGLLDTTVDLYNVSSLWKQVLYTNNNLSHGQHTITIKPTNTKNDLSSGYYTSVDAFDVDDIEHEYCAPVAEANSFWWLDKKYQFGIFEYPYDGLGYIGGDINGDGVADILDFVQDLAWYKDTNGQRTHEPHIGTTVLDEQAGIHDFLVDYGLDDQLYEHTAWDSGFPDPNPGFPPYTGWLEFFHFLEDEVYRSQDVKLDLGFWHILECIGEPGDGQILWQRVGGHAVTVAGVDSQNLLFAISDPDNDAAEVNPLNGVVRPDPQSHPPYPHDPSVHNNEMFASHDTYTVVHSPSPGGKMGLQNYPPKFNLPIGEPILAPWPVDFIECYHSNVLTEIEAAVIVSPIICGNGVIDPGEECDDGNVVEHDGCDNSCVIEYCGDNDVDPGLGEQCDDGNANNNDGCTNHCYTPFGNVTCSFDPVHTEPIRLIRGGLLRFWATANNNTGDPLTFKFATKVDVPNPVPPPSHNLYPSSGLGPPYLLGPITVPNLGAGLSVSKYLTQSIPLNAPYGTYTYHGYVGNPGVGLYSQCSFTFSVLE